MTGADLDLRLGGDNLPVVPIPHTLQAPAAPTAHRGRSGRRVLPHEAEHERRKAWGAKWGPLVGKSIRDALEAAA